jgi:hypothetical protein
MIKDLQEKGENIADEWMDAFTQFSRLHYKDELDTLNPVLNSYARYGVLKTNDINKYGSNKVF